MKLLICHNPRAQVAGDKKSSSLFSNEIRRRKYPPVYEAPSLFLSDRVNSFPFVFREKVDDRAEERFQGVGEEEDCYFFHPYGR